MKLGKALTTVLALIVVYLAVSAIRSRGYEKFGDWGRIVSKQQKAPVK